MFAGKPWLLLLENCCRSHALSPSARFILSERCLTNHPYIRRKLAQTPEVDTPTRPPETSRRVPRRVVRRTSASSFVQRTAMLKTRYLVDTQRVAIPGLSRCCGLFWAMARITFHATFTYAENSFRNLIPVRRNIYCCTVWLVEVTSRFLHLVNLFVGAMLLLNSICVQGLRLLWTVISDNTPIFAEKLGAI